MLVGQKEGELNDKQDMQGTFKVTLRGIRAAIVAVAKHYIIHVLNMCLQPYLSNIQCICVALYCLVWPVWLSHIFPYYRIKGTIKKKILKIDWVS